jgi:hypothetical protein
VGNVPDDMKPATLTSFFFPPITETSKKALVDLTEILVNIKDTLLFFTGQSKQQIEPWKILLNQ